MINIIFYFRLSLDNRGIITFTTGVTLMTKRKFKCPECGGDSYGINMYGYANVVKTCTTCGFRWYKEDDYKYLGGYDETVRRGPSTTL